MTDPLVARAADYYSRKLAQFGATPKGADWNTRESQDLRFEQLLRIGGNTPMSVNDYGCGYGALAVLLRQTGRMADYCGYDASVPMIAAAVAEVGTDERCRFTANRAEMIARPYTIASGIFNVKEDTAGDEWWRYVVSTLADIATLSTTGFACNFLTSYSDADRRRADLFYADPSEVLRHCLATYSRKAVLVHDYPLYEFTVLVTL